MIEITDEHRQLYREGKFVMPIPPVYTGSWNEDSWIKWIIISGKFLFPVKK